MNQMYGGMYGGSFIDILFKQVMQYGWEGFNVTFIFYFYVYLSLEKIKAGFLKLNDKLAEKGQQFIDNYGARASNYMLRYWSRYNFRRLIIFKRKSPQPMVKLLPSVPQPNRFTTCLIDQNRLDILAIGNYLIKKEGWAHKNSRLSSDQYKTSESFAIPEEIGWNFNDVKVTFKQQVDLKLICETTHNTEIVKDFVVTITDNCVKNVSFHNFNTYYSLFCQIYTEKLSFLRGIDWEPFKFKGKLLTPERLFGGFYIDIVYMIYYNKDIKMLDKFIKFLLATESWFIDGVEYRMIKAVEINVGNNIKEYEKIRDEFLEQCENYCETFNKQLDKEENKKCKEALEQLTQQHHFDPVEKFIPAFNLIFEHDTLSPNELAVVSRDMMREFITDYYQQNTGTDGQVSVYKLQIDYDTEIKEKPNPVYEAWFEHYGSMDSQTSDKDEKPRHMFAPAKTITEEVLVPKVACNHIKTDSKPFQYLYLQEKEKTVLHNYLENFKSNKEIYKKFGFPYKGGIILSGSPGCGKTSAIMSIATYLNKDVFYIDLGQISTNKELKMCLDHIKSTQNGGVIIFEDIDCMTSIVLRRDENRLTSNAKDALSLSFLLNVIDGTMAPENVVFVITTNHLEKLDPALIRPGRMDISLELQKCSRYQLGNIFRDLYNRELREDLLEQFPEYKYITANVILHLFHNTYSNNIDDAKLMEKFL